MHRLLVRLRPPEVDGRSGFQLQKAQKLTLDYSNLKNTKKTIINYKKYELPYIWSEREKKKKAVRDSLHRPIKK